MPAGLQCFDASGKLILDITDYTTMVYGTIDINWENGCLYDDRLIEGRSWFAITGFHDSGGEPPIPPKISISNGSLTWEAEQVNKICGNYCGCTVIYGGYSSE